MALPVLFKILNDNFSSTSKKGVARVTPRGVLTQDDVVKRIVKRGTTFGEADLRGAIMLYEEVVMDAVAEGYHVNTPVFNARPTIKGSFDSRTDTFDVARHTIEVSLSQGTGFSKRMKLATAQRSLSSDPRPDLSQYIDHNSGTINQTVTPGGIGELYGHQLNFDPADPLCGIFFTELSSGVESRVQVVPTLEPKKLVFLVPDLPPGQYRVEVRKSYTQRNTLRQKALDRTLNCG